MVALGFTKCLRKTALGWILSAVIICWVVAQMLILSCVMLRVASPENQQNETLFRSDTTFVVDEIHKQSRRLDLSIAIDNAILFDASGDGKSIRRWGCSRTETPFIFVHIGKAGGGRIRPRMAAAAQDYGRGKKWRKDHGDEHYYPIQEVGSSTMRRGKFCHSKNHNFRVPYEGVLAWSFEGTKPCNATTPIGHAIGCPASPKCSGCSDINSAICDTVYVGHNYLGSEMHWLPPKYLQRWWYQYWSNKSLHSSFERVDHGFHSIIPHEHRRWCPNYNLDRPLQPLENELFIECSNLAAIRADADFRQYWSLVTKANDYSPLYASLPLHRAVMIREPFPWLKSKFYWHRHFLNCTCDDIQCASKPETGWAYASIKSYVLQICGEDCLSRSVTNQITWEEVVTQAEGNLRMSFSVVGLLNETDSFYDMITTRISYMNMSLHPEVDGGRHSSRRAGKGYTRAEYTRCSKVFEDAAFQQKFKEELPMLVSLEHLYQVGVEVNRFQKEELHQCRERTNTK